MYLNDFIKIIVACILGGLIGYQRQKKGMSMGLRTHIVVCVSAALVQIISIDYNLITNSNVDVMRLGAQVISGIGFLGMASIIKDGRTVVGLTTAACIWFVACIGLAVGSGLFIPALLSTIVIYFTLLDVFNLDRRIKNKRNSANHHELEIILKDALTNKNKVSSILNMISELGAEISDTQINMEDNDNIMVLLAITLPSKNLYNELLKTLSKYDYIKKININ